MNIELRVVFTACSSELGLRDYILPSYFYNARLLLPGISRWLPGAWVGVVEHRYETSALLRKECLSEMALALKAALLRCKAEHRQGRSWVNRFRHNFFHPALRTISSRFSGSSSTSK